MSGGVDSCITSRMWPRSIAAICSFEPGNRACSMSPDVRRPLESRNWGAKFRSPSDISGHATLRVRFAGSWWPAYRVANPNHPSAPSLSPAWQINNLPVPYRFQRQVHVHPPKVPASRLAVDLGHWHTMARCHWHHAPSAPSPVTWPLCEPI